MGGLYESRRKKSTTIYVRLNDDHMEITWLNCYFSALIGRKCLCHFPSTSHVLWDDKQRQMRTPLPPIDSISISDESYSNQDICVMEGHTSGDKRRWWASVYLSIGRYEGHGITSCTYLFYQLRPQCVSEVDGIREEEEINTNDKKNICNRINTVS